MSDVILICESCGDRKSITEVSLGEICRECHMDGYRIGYGIYFDKPIQLPDTPTVVDAAAATVQLTDGSEGEE